MSVIDNLDVKTYKRILNKYEKNTDVDVCRMMATEMEQPRGFGMICLYCCCFCCIHGMINTYITRRAHAIDELFIKKYPNKNMNELMSILKNALNIVEKHKMKLYDVRNRTDDHLKIRYQSLTDDELRIIQQAHHLLNPVVYVV